MSHICKKERECGQLEADINRHRRARQLASFELNRIKTVTRKLRLNVTPSGEDQRWLSKVPMTIWLNEKFHSCKAQLLDFKLKQLRIEVELEKGPMDWLEFNKQSDFLTELKDNIVRFEISNDVFLREENCSPYYNLRNN